MTNEKTGKSRAEKLADREGRIAFLREVRDYIKKRQIRLLEQGDLVAQGQKRESIFDDYMTLVEAKHILAPDPAYLANRRLDQREVVRQITRLNRKMAP